MENEVKILIAEDDSIDIELMHNELQKSGIRYVSRVVDKEDDYVEALKTFVPDLILADYRFPSFDGPTAFVKRQTLAPDTPFIFVSGTIGEEQSVELIKMGVTDYCLKERLFTLNQKVLRALTEAKSRQGKKHIEAEQHQSEKRLARAQELAHMGSWELNFATNCLIWSNETFRIYGLQPDKINPSLEYVLSFVHAEDLNFVRKKIEDSSTLLNDFAITYRIVQTNGSIRHVYLDSKLEFDSKGIATGLFGIIHDVTAMTLLENKLSEERLVRQKDITDAVLTAQENERAEIGRELHDNVGQVLGAIKLYIELAKTDDENREMCLEKSSVYICSVIELIRKISKKFINPSLHPLGLFDCINILKNEMAIVNPIKIAFNVKGIGEEEIGEKLQLNIYRIIQEQLNNILKHAKATRATININRNGDEVILVISDNGIGFDTSKTRTGVGIRNIISRAESFHGRAEIKSRRGKGYKLKVELPFRPLRAIG